MSGSIHADSAANESTGSGFVAAQRGSVKPLNIWKRKALGQDHRFTCVCGHRYNVHYSSGPCAAADSRPDQRTGSGCQCKEWSQP